MVLEERERNASKTRRKEEEEEEEVRTAGCTAVSDGTKGRTVPRNTSDAVVVAGAAAPSRRRWC